jgi:hypothetical protein
VNDNILTGWRKLLATVGGGTALGLDAVPDHLVWPFVAVLGCYLIGQSLVDAAKAWRAE